MSNFVINQEEKALLIRFKNFKNKDFVYEHNQKLDQNGRVWMVKLGRHVVEEKLKQVLSESGILILKAPKSIGGKYYCTYIYDYYYGLPNKNFNFPSYYDELLSERLYWTDNSLNGTWIHIGKIVELRNSDAQQLYLISNHKKVTDVLNHTMSSVLYVQSSKKILA